MVVSRQVVFTIVYVTREVRGVFWSVMYVHSVRRGRGLLVL